MSNATLAVAEARPSRRSRHLTPEELAVVRYRLSASQGPRPRLYGRQMPLGRIDAIAARPAVAAAIRRAVRHILATRLAPTALGAMEAILERSEDPATVVAAARVIIQMAGRDWFDALADADDVPLLEMSEAQLAAFVAAVRARLAAREADVDIFS